MANHADAEASTILATTDSERSDENDELSEDDDEDEEDEDSNEYVDEKVNEQFGQQYQHAQTQTLVFRPAPGAPSTTLTVADFYDFGERPVRRKTKAAANYNAKEVKEFPYKSDQSVSAKGKSKSWKGFPKPDPATKARWERRQSEEIQEQTSRNVFTPTANDVLRWKHTNNELLSSRDQWKLRRKSQEGMMSSNRHSSSNNIVEEYLSPSDQVFDADFETFRNLTDAAKQEVIQREAEENGLEKPKGYTVSFHYNPHVEYHHFGSSHPMKPWRLTLTKQLVVAYGLEYTMDIYEPRPASFDELAVFHDREYLSFISKVTPQNMIPDDPNYLAFGFGGESNDCPVFDGLWNYVSLYSGASMHAAHNLLNNQSDIAINWSGGLHHAKKNLASGFCYVNDIVLAIQHLLTQNQRVLYIDIDVHHGDGVEQAFESTDRVFTLSYHKYGIDKNGYPFFPGTGAIHEMGPIDPRNRGKGHSLNIPIEDGIDDDQYKWLFKTVTGAVVEKYQPTAIVLQSGADSLGGDRLGRFNLNIKAHGYCVETVKNYGRPLLLIGGGGYTPRNVARTWCHETAVCVEAELHNNLPSHIPYIQAFKGEENGGGILYPDLHNTKRHDNANSVTKLQKLVETALENLRFLEGAPSVVVNTRGITEEEIMRVREMVDREIEEEAEDRHLLSVERARRGREKNVGGRGERR